MARVQIRHSNSRANSRRPRTSIALAAAVAAVGCAGRAKAVPPAITRSVPADVVAAYFFSPRDEEAQTGRAGSVLNLAGSLIDGASAAGLLSVLGSEARVWMEALAAVADVMNHQHAVAIFGVDAAPREDGGHQLSGLRVALVIHVPGETGRRIDLRVQNLLNAYTNSELTTLAQGSFRGTAMYSLRDRRLPDWAIVGWGRVGDYFIATLGGDEVFRHVALAIRGPDESLGDSRGFARAFERASGPAAILAVYVRFDLLKRDAGPRLREKMSGVLYSLGLGDVDSALWTYGYEGRSVEARCFLRRGTRDEIVSIAGKRFLEGGSGTQIPAEATRYAVIGRAPRRIAGRLANAYLASRSHGSAERTRAFWHDVETGSGVRFEEDILSHIVGPVVIHDYPIHPLQLPFARTIQVGVAGDSAALRANLDKLLGYAQSSIAANYALPLVRSSDGVWYVGLGVIAPSVAVTDRWLVVGHSPDAVRRNLSLLEKRASPELPVTVEKLQNTGDSGRDRGL